MFINIQAEAKKLLASDEVRKVLAWLKGRFDRVVDALTAIQRMLAYEHGLPVIDIPPHDPRRLPYVHRVEGATSERLNISAALGKPVTRGEIINYGDTNALLIFIQKDGATENSIEYLLPSGTTISPSWFYDAVEIKDAGEGPVKVQVLAQ